MATPLNTSINISQLDFSNSFVPNNQLNWSEVINTYCDDWNNIINTSHDFYMILIIIHLIVGLLANWFRPKLVLFEANKKYYEYEFTKKLPKFINMFLEKRYKQNFEKIEIDILKDVHDITILIIIFRIVSVWSILKFNLGVI